MSLAGKHIFMVEDNAINVAVIRTILRRAKAVVPFDNWGDLNLEKMLTYPYPLDMILLDLMLANGISGYEMLDAIRANEVLKDIPVVCVSASVPDVDDMRARGFNGYIPKPIRAQSFIAQLEAILDGDQNIWGDDW